MEAPRSPDRGGGKNVRRLWLAAALLFALVFAQTPDPARADHDINHVAQKIKELDRAIQVSRQNAERLRRASAEYQGAVAAANQRISQLMAKQDTLASEAEEIANEIAITEEQLSLATLQLNETVAHVGSLDAAIDENSKLLERRQEMYGQHLRQLYRQSQVTPLEMLLVSRSLADFAERVQLMTLVLRQDQQLAADLRRLRESNAEKRLTADLKRQEVDGLKLQITNQRDQLNEEKERLERILSDTVQARFATEANRNRAAQNASAAQNAARNAQAQAADLERRKLQAEALYAQLAARLQGSSGLTSSWAGKFAVWPLSGPLTSYFGPRWGGFHNGVDVAAPMYTPIRAAHAGVVQVVGKPYLASGDTATVVIIAHASNMSTLYGHLDDGPRRPIVSPGQRVTAGQIIGYVGMSGWTTGPHLHFMTIFNAQAVDPLRYLP